MTRHRLLPVLFVSLLVAACGGGAAPTRRPPRPVHRRCRPVRGAVRRRPQASVIPVIVARARCRAPTGSCSRSWTRRPTSRPRRPTARPPWRSSRPARRSPDRRPRRSSCGPSRASAATTWRTWSSARPATTRPCSSPRPRARRRRRSAWTSRSPSRARRSRSGRRHRQPTTRPSRRRRACDRVSTDPHPDPDFYELTVKEALAAKQPFVLVFATPAFCQSAQCGPTLDRVKAVAADAPDNVRFINVEPYQLDVHGGAPPAEPRREQPAPAGRVRERRGASSRSRGCSPWTGRAWSAAPSRASSARTSSRPRSRRSPGPSGPARHGVLDPVGRRLAVLVAEEHPDLGPRRRGAPPRWLGGNLSPFSSWPIAKVGLRPSSRRIVKARTL